MPVRAQHARDLGRELGVEQAALGDVDGDREVVAGLLPDAELLQRGAQDEARQRLDQPGLLGERDELAGRQQALLRVQPAHERLDADDRAGAELQLGLVVQHELVAARAPGAARRGA